MGVGYNPRIVTNGLVLCLDAGNARSYPGSGTTWTDLSGNGNNGTLVNSPTFSTDNGGSFIFNGSTTHVTFVSASSFTFGTGNFAVDYWVRYTSFPNSTVAVDMRSVDIGPGYADFTTTLGAYRYYSSNLTKFSATTTFATNTWINVIATRISSSVSVYFNAVQEGSSFTENVNYDNNSLIIGTTLTKTSTAYLNGRISCVKLYNRGLSAAEIRQNFNALRGRYGI